MSLGPPALWTIFSNISGLQPMYYIIITATVLCSRWYFHFSVASKLRWGGCKSISYLVFSLSSSIHSSWTNAPVPLWSNSLKKWWQNSCMEMEDVVIRVVKISRERYVQDLIDFWLKINIPKENHLILRNGVVGEV